MGNKVRIFLCLQIEVIHTMWINGLYFVDKTAFSIILTLFLLATLS